MNDGLRLRLRHRRRPSFRVSFGKSLAAPATLPDLTPLNSRHRPDGHIVTEAARNVADSEGKGAVAVARSQDLGPERQAEMHPSDLLLAELIHRAANDLTMASIEICNASKLASCAAVQGHLELVGARLHALASIQRLLQRPGEAPIDLGNRLCELCHHYAEARFAGQGAFVRLRTAEVWADPEPGWALLLIVSELLTNAARHAFRTPGGLVEIELVREGDVIRCEIADNGVGIGRETAPRRAGLALITELARSADIAFALQPRDRGSRFELRLVCSGYQASPTVADDRPCLAVPHASRKR